ncbi:type 1 fimbrial protein [Salmonella enterica]|nr:type 1 fimbrial protein [Salmonella enterica subsp. enterica serovar Sandiego]EIQ4400423.1 type 1 fimbrial protein [Salmonella enterica]
MKGVKSLFLLGTALAVMSSSALADTTGTQTFTANVAANTCTIDNLNKTVDLGAINLSSFTTKEGSGWYVSPGIGVNEAFKVTNCPNTLTKVKVVPTFTQGAGGDVVKNAGTAGNIDLWFNRTIDDIRPTAKDTWINGGGREFVLAAGGVDVPVNGIILKTSAENIPGTLDYQMAFAFDFE